MRLRQAVVMLAAALALAAAQSRAEDIKIGVVKIAAAGAVFIAKEKGYFAAEGLDAQIVYFGSPEPIAVAAVSGDIQFGATGASAGLYSLASQGALKIIASQAHEEPGFQVNGFVIANRAYDSGLKTYADLPGHTVGVPEIGSSNHYAAALIAEKHHVDLKRIRFMPLQGNPNVLSAVVGGSVDSGVVPATMLVPALQNNKIKLLCWVGDEAPWQSSAVFTSTKIANEKPDLVKHYLRAVQKAEREYHDAFTAPDGTRKDGPTAPEILAILAKYTGQTPVQISRGIAYVDPEGRFDVKDFRHQIAWFKAQNMLKPSVKADAILDRRYLLPLADR